MKIINDKYLKNTHHDPDIPDHYKIKKNFIPKVKDIIEIVAQFYAVKQSDNTKISRGKSNFSKSIAIFIAVESCQISLRHIGDELGNLSSHGISSHYRRFRKYLETNSSLLVEIKQMRDLLKKQMNHDALRPSISSFIRFQEKFGENLTTRLFFKSFYSAS